jgi:hypothetical protein
MAHKKTLEFICASSQRIFLIENRLLLIETT